MSEFFVYPNPEGNTPLLWAVGNADLEMVKELLTAGANVFHQNNAGETALSLAVGHADITAELLAVIATATTPGRANEGN